MGYLLCGVWCYSWLPLRTQGCTPEDPKPQNAQKPLGSSSSLHSPPRPRALEWARLLPHRRLEAARHHLPHPCTYHIHIHPVFPLRVLPDTLDLSSAPRSWSCLSYSLSVLWLLLGMSVGSSTTLKQTKQKQEQTKNTESLSFGPSAPLNAGTSCSLHFRWSKCCTSFHLPHDPLVCLGSYASGPTRSPFSAPSLPWPWTLPSSPILCL